MADLAAASEQVAEISKPSILEIPAGAS